jgi:hypothetical protein
MPPNIAIQAACIIKDALENVINPAKEDGNLASIKTNTDANAATLFLLHRLITLLESLGVVDVSKRQKVNVDAYAQMTVLGTALSTGFVNAPGNYGPAPSAATTYWQPVWIGPVDQRWEIMDRARTAYNLGIRSQLSFT